MEGGQVGQQRAEAARHAAATEFEVLQQQPPLHGAAAAGARGGGGSGRGRRRGGGAGRKAGQETCGAGEQRVVAGEGAAPGCGCGFVWQRRGVGGGLGAEGGERREKGGLKQALTSRAARGDGERAAYYSPFPELDGRRSVQREVQRRQVAQLFRSMARGGRVRGRHGWRRGIAGSHGGASDQSDSTRQSSGDRPLHPGCSRLLAKRHKSAGAGARARLREPGEAHRGELYGKSAEYHLEGAPPARRGWRLCKEGECLGLDPVQGPAD